MPTVGEVKLPAEQSEPRPEHVADAPLGLIRIATHPKPAVNASASDISSTFAICVTSGEDI